MTEKLQQKMEMLIYNLLADQVLCGNGLIDCGLQMDLNIRGH